MDIKERIEMKAAMEEFFLDSIKETTFNDTIVAERARARLEAYQIVLAIIKEGENAN